MQHRVCVRARGAAHPQRADEGRREEAWHDDIAVALQRRHVVPLQRDARRRRAHGGVGVRLGGGEGLRAAPGGVGAEERGKRRGMRAERRGEGSPRRPRKVA